MSRADDYIATSCRVRVRLLICLDQRVALYRRLGWEVVSDRRPSEQPSGPSFNPINTMVRPFRGRPGRPAGRPGRLLPW